MPDLELGVEGPVLGRMEIWGIIGNSDNAGTANSYYTLQSGQSYSNPPCQAPPFWVGRNSPPPGAA